MPVNSIDRYRGAMVGTLCGDALGAPYEWKDPDYIRKDIEARGGLNACEYIPFDYIDPWKKKQIILKGHPTDDSELAAALGLNLVSNSTFNATDLYNRLRSFVHDRKSILSDVAYGTGGTLRASLTPETYAESVAKFTAHEIPTPPSNGSLMRCISVPLGGYPNVDYTIFLAEEQSMITHQNPLSVSACMAYSAFVNLLLTGTLPKYAWSEAMAYLSHYPGKHNRNAMKEVLDIPITKPDYLTEIKGKEGSVVLSLRIAVWATVTAESFADGILKAILVGGDTDTYAAIAGGSLGVHFGLSNIPQEWLGILQGKDVMIDIADKLYKRSLYTTGQGHHD